MGKYWLKSNWKYCASITLDFKNAVNSANWDATTVTLDAKSIPNYLLELVKDCFKDRVLLYDADDGRKSYAVLAKVPKYSVLGPILWNVVYDGVMRLKVPKGVEIIGFADDIALVKEGKHLNKLVRTCNTAVGMVRPDKQSWI